MGVRSTAKPPLAESLWIKSPLAVLWGLVLSISLLLNAYHLLPLPIDVRLFIGLLLGFTIWAGVVTYCCAYQSIWEASRNCLKLLLASAACNLVLFIF